MGNDWNSTDSNNEIVLVSIKGRFDKISNQAHWFMAETILTIEQFEGKFILYEHQQGWKVVVMWRKRQCATLFEGKCIWWALKYLSSQMCCVVLYPQSRADHNNRISV